jgi:hypothetical protein
MESDLKSIKLKATFENIKNKGGFLGKEAPFGYKVVRINGLRKLEPNTYEQKILKEIKELAISYSNNRKQLATNFINDNLVTIQEYQYIDFGNSTNFSLTFDKKFKQIPLGLGFSSNNSISYNKTISNNIKNNNRFNQNNIDFNVKSYFKNKPNFDIGIIYLSNFNQFETEVATNKSELQTYIPYIKLEGTLFNKKINWKINSTYNIFNSSSFETQNIFDLSTRIQYTTNKKINIYFNANNLLNIRENNFKNNFIQTDILLQETNMNTLSGFANFGINYSF